MLSCSFFTSHQAPWPGLHSAVDVRIVPCRTVVHPCLRLLSVIGSRGCALLLYTITSGKYISQTSWRDNVKTHAQGVVNTGVALPLVNDLFLFFYRCKLDNTMCILYIYLYIYMLIPLYYSHPCPSLLLPRVFPLIFPSLSSS